MIRLAIWLLAGVSISSGVLLISFLLRSRGEVPSGIGGASVGILQLSAVVLTILALGASLVALQVALTSRHGESRDKSQAGLAERFPVVEPVQTTSQPPQLEIIPEPEKTEENAAETRARLEESPVAQAPAVEFLLADSHLSDLPTPIPIPIGPTGARLHLVVRNNGTASALSGTLVVIADPNTLRVDEAARRTKNRWNPHRFQKALPDVPPLSKDSGDIQLDLSVDSVDGTIPETFSLSLVVFGENFEAVRRKVTFQALP